MPGNKQYPSKRYIATRVLGGAAATAIAGGLAKLTGKDYASKQKAKSKDRRTGTTRSRSATTKKVVKQGPTANDMSSISAKGGRKMKHTLGNAWKLLQKETADVKFSLKAIAPFANAEQQIPIDFTQSTSNGSFNAPLHMYDVTSCINNGNVGGVNNNDTIAPYSPGFYLTGTTQQSFISGVGPVYTFNNLSGFAQSNAGGVPYYGTTWAPEQDPFTPSKLNNLPGPHSMLKWMKLKMFCTSPVTRPCKWTVQLVQIKDQFLHPDLEGITTSNAAAINDNLRRDAFYGQLVNKYVFNPIADGSYKIIKDNLKVIKTIEWVTNPELSTDPDNAGHQKLVNLFYRFDKELDYAWDQNAIQQIGYSNDIPLNIGVNRNVVRPEKRIYLMVRAQTSPGTSHNPSIHGSYSINMTTCHAVSGA